MSRVQIHTPTSFSGSILEIEHLNYASITEDGVDDVDEKFEEAVNTFDIQCNGGNGDVHEEKDCPAGEGRSDRSSPKSDTPIIRKYRSKLAKSVRSPVDRKRAKFYSPDRRSVVDESRRVMELEQRMEMLEAELREAAAIEVSLYAVVAEHGNSIGKVHAPARRLSRLYLRSGEGDDHLMEARAARSAVSGLIAVAKACGNDVPRLTFWFSNSVVLRAIIKQCYTEKQSTVSDGPLNEVHETGMKRSPSLTWKSSPSHKKAASRSYNHGNPEDWEDPNTFITALEKFESWIFSRIIESVWWQTLTPHMQSSAAKAVNKVMDSGTRKSFRRQPSSCNLDQVNLSLEIWKKAFKDACERLCPVRAAGHECGCLPTLSKLIMEQCVARLDVAMFNALLREPGVDSPTDPVSDPISEARVLPIEARKLSFGAGVQLKSVIGNWSRWLSTLFGMDDDDDYDNPTDDESDQNGDDSFDDDEKRKPNAPFHLLKSLSDVMMLRKDMLTDSSIREKVCPSFSIQLIKRILNNFAPDEFCPDKIPDSIMQALEDIEADKGFISHLPCSAPVVMYVAPKAFSVASIVGDGAVGNQSSSQLSRSLSLLRKSNISDDELDELESPMDRIVDVRSSINLEALSPTRNGLYWNTEEAVRYQLLREVWNE